MQDETGARPRRSDGAALSGARKPGAALGQIGRREFLLRSALCALPGLGWAQPSDMNPAPALPGERLHIDAGGRPLQLCIAGEGPPLLLVHSINAAASSAEVRPLHLHYQGTHTVVSVDLPGFGGSDRSDRAYTPRLMTDALHATTAFVQQRLGRTPIDALAASLSCEFLARAAVEAPAAYRSLALVSPTGLAGRDQRRGPPESTLGPPWLHGLVRGPGWGRWMFKGLTRPSVIRYFLQKTWGSPQIDEELWQQAVINAQAPGAEHAPLYFLSGGLFSRDIQDVYEQLQVPVWMSHGVRGDFTDYRQKNLLAARANWHFSVFKTGALPYFEALDPFTQAWDAFLSNAGGAA